MITILCSGSRGDVQPYIALAQSLVKLGLVVRIAANKDFEHFVRGYGIDFFAIDVDMASAGVDPEFVRKAQRADNVLKMASSFRKMRDYAVHMVENYHDACLGSDAIVYHPGLAVGYFMARKLGIPAILASPFPLHVTKERASLVLYGKTPPVGFVNRASYRVLQGMLWMATASSLKSFWKKKYGLLPEAFGAPFERQTDAMYPAIVSCSDAVFPRPADWNAHVRQDGYWFVEEPAEYQPSRELGNFLASGDKPVYVGFGSMYDREGGEKLARAAIEGVLRAGRRVIASGMGTLKGLPDTVLCIEGAPHSWLFPRVAAVCHHGGAGTSAAGFRAGVASVIVPFALDQHTWALRAFELGVGSRPVPAKKLTSERIERAIREALRPEIVENARILGERIALEPGAAASAGVIASTLR